MWYIGVHRYVLIVGKLAIKFPRINIGDLVKVIKAWGLTKLGFKLMCSAISDGFMENIREASCYYKTRHPLLARLYLPLILVNVYQQEDGVGHFCFEAEELYAGAWKSGDRELAGALRPCSHTFDRRENFAYNKRGVKIIDYGEDGFANLLTKHGSKVEKFLTSKAQVK